LAEKIAMTALLFAVVTAFIGAALAHFFQTRSWIFQQQRRIQEEQLSAIQKTISQLAKAVFERLSLSQQLVFALGTNDTAWHDELLARYRRMLEEFRVTWLECATVITREQSDGFEKVRRFEDDILAPLVGIGCSIEGGVRLSRSGKMRDFARERQELRRLNNVSFGFIRDLYANLQLLRNDTLVVDLRKVSERSIYNLDTWNLVKLLFMRPNSL
jgi:hypothetical protein